MLTECEKVILVEIMLTECEETILVIWYNQIGWIDYMI